MTKICGSKSCEHSGLQQENNKFYKDASKPTGLKSWCIACCKIKARKNWAKDVNSYYAYHACYVALIKPAVDAAIDMLIAESVALSARRGPVRNKKEIIAENAVMIFKLGLIK